MTAQPLPSSAPQNKSVFAPDLVRPALLQSVVKLDQRSMVRNPDMFVGEIRKLVTLVLTVTNAVAGRPFGFELAITLLLLFTVLFANFAEALAEARGKAQAASLRSARSDTKARRLENGKEVSVSSLELRRGDRVVVSAGEFIPGVSFLDRMIGLVEGASRQKTRTRSPRRGSSRR